jgi:hypothetical protein
VPWSQIGFSDALQSTLLTHSTHFPEGAHAGVAALTATHSAALPHPRQAFVPMSHTGFSATPHCVLAVHSTHAPVEAHAGIVALLPLHSSFEEQALQALVAISQIGLVVPVHSSLALHSMHFPDGSQTGVAAFKDEHSAEEAQARHFLETPSQTGVATLHPIEPHNVAPSFCESSLASAPSRPPPSAVPEGTHRPFPLGLLSRLHVWPDGQSDALSQRPGRRSFLQATRKTTDASSARDLVDIKTGLRSRRLTGERPLPPPHGLSALAARRMLPRQVHQQRGR